MEAGTDVATPSNPEATPLMTDEATPLFSGSANGEVSSTFFTFNLSNFMIFHFQF